MTAGLSILCIMMSFLIMKALYNYKSICRKHGKYWKVKQKIKSSRIPSLSYNHYVYFVIVPLRHFPVQRNAHKWNWDNTRYFKTYNFYLTMCHKHPPRYLHILLKIFVFLNGHFYSFGGLQQWWDFVVKKWKRTQRYVGRTWKSSHKLSSKRYRDFCSVCWSLLTLARWANCVHLSLTDFTCIMPSSFIHVVCSRISFFLWLNNIPLCIFTIFSLSIHPLMNT